MKRASSKGNPWHDERGRFCSGPRGRADWISDGKGGITATIYEDETKKMVCDIKHIPKRKVEWEGSEEDAIAQSMGIKKVQKTQRGYDKQSFRRLYNSGIAIEVNGPKDTVRFIKKNERIDYSEYASVKERVISFNQSEMGTYDVDGNAVQPTGYSVTFHQNHTQDDRFGGYTSEEYAYMCAYSKKKLKSDLYIGYFDGPEVSFACKSKLEAMRFAIIHNQHSIWNNDEADEKKALIINPYYDSSLNPTF